MAKKASVMMLRAPYLLPGLPQIRRDEKQRVAGRCSRPPASSLDSNNHQERRIGGERRPEAGAAESDEPGEPQPRLRNEAADIGKRIGGTRPTRPDKRVVAEPIAPEHDEQRPSRKEPITTRCGATMP